MKKFLLLIAGLFLSTLFYREAFITTVLHYHDGGVFTSYTKEPLTAGEYIRGQFVAAGDNLATVKLRVNTFNRINTTHVRFQLKEQGDDAWLVINEYTTDRFADGLLCPFGFPPIADSKGKTYEFELSGLDGYVDNAIGIQQGYHDVASMFVPTARNAQFFKEKFLSMLIDPFMWLYAGLFIVPALGLLMGQRAILLAYLLAVYIFLPVDMHSNIVLYIAAAGWYLGRLSRTRARTAYIVGILCLLLIPLALLLGNTLAAQRAATLIFFSLLTAVIMSI